MRSEDLQHIANNLPDSFTDYKGVIQSYNPENMPERVEVPTKTTQLPVQSNRGRSTAIVHQDSLLASKDIKACESVNASQLHVDRHLMGSIHPVDGKPPPTQVIVHTMTGTSEYPTQSHWEIASSHHG